MELSNKIEQENLEVKYAFNQSYKSRRLEFANLIKNHYPTLKKDNLETTVREEIQNNIRKASKNLTSIGGWKVWKNALILFLGAGFAGLGGDYFAIPYLLFKSGEKLFKVLDKELIKYRLYH